MDKPIEPSHYDCFVAFEKEINKWDRLSEVYNNLDIDDKVELFSFVFSVLKKYLGRQL